MQSDTATVSTAPLSPFSSSTSVSGISGDATSDEPADLGAFASVFRALSQFHRLTANPAHPTSVYVTSASESEGGSRMSSILSRNHSHTVSSTYVASDDDTSVLPESELDSVFEEVFSGSETEEDVTPSLGDLDSALGFIAAEKARLAAQLDSRGPTSSLFTSPDTPWQHVVEPKRKRRRRRKGKEDPISLTVTDDDHDEEEEEEDPEAYISSSPRNITPIPIPIPTRRRRRTHLIEPSPPLSTPRRIAETPSHRPLPVPPDPRLQRLRTLARKLATVCPKESISLQRILLEDISPDAPYIDPRGPEPLQEQTEEPLVHVFVDHSNILVGFLSWIKRQPSFSRTNSPSNKPKPRLSHPALVLVLERGRAISKRVLVASSPLHQDLDPLAELEYEVSVLQRVAVVDDSGGSDGPNWKKKGRRAALPSVFHSDGGTGTESDPTAGLLPQSSPPNKAMRSPPGRSTHHRTVSSNSLPSRPVRPKYREQAVDELLQLKLLQALLDAPSPPPPGSTIVLATGDGASSQFNSDGFLGCVKKAVERGWMVELVAWEGGLSRSWLEEFRDARDRFGILELDKFAEDLIDH